MSTKTKTKRKAGKIQPSTLIALKEKFSFLSIVQNMDKSDPLPDEARVRVKRLSGGEFLLPLSHPAKDSCVTAVKWHLVLWEATHQFSALSAPGRWVVTEPYKADSQELRTLRSDSNYGDLVAFFFVRETIKYLSESERAPELDDIKGLVEIRYELNDATGEVDNLIIINKIAIDTHNYIDTTLLEPLHFMYQEFRFPL